MRDHFYTRTIEPLIQRDNIDVIQYLRLKGLLKTTLPCSSCSTPMSTKPYTRNKDEFGFRCLKKECLSYKKYHSIRTGSIFSPYKFSLKTGIKLLYKFLSDAKEKDIKDEVSVDDKVLIAFYDDVRKCCCRYWVRNPCQLGGSDIICQIDESLFRHKPKYHRGRATEHEIWVFGIADTSYSPARVYLEVVQNRSAAVLLPIVQRVCRAGSIIVSDQWRSYNNIDSLGFEHRTVNHSLYFVEPITNTNTQTIESYWAKVKSRIKIKK